MSDGANYKECDEIKWFPDCILLFSVIIAFTLYSMLPPSKLLHDAASPASVPLLEVSGEDLCFGLGHHHMTVAELEYHKISYPSVPPELYHLDLGKELSVSLKIFLRVLI